MEIILQGLKPKLLFYHVDILSTLLYFLSLAWWMLYYLMINVILKMKYTSLKEMDLSLQALSEMLDKK